MTSYSDNAYDFAYTLFLPSFIVVRPQLAELNRGAFLLHYRGIPDPVQNRVKGPVKPIQRVKIVHSFYTVCVKSVPLYHFKLAYAVLHMAVIRPISPFLEVSLEKLENFFDSHM